MTRAPRSLAPLQHRGFRLLVGGQLASNIGDAFYMVALPWYVLANHGGALLLGTVLAAYGIPRTTLIFAGGHASDRWRPWTAMMGADCVRVVAAAGLAVAAASGPARASVLVPIAVVLGAGEGVFLPGSFSIIPALLADDDLQAGNALSSAGTQLATLIGPAIGGAMVALIGPSPAFALDAASFAVSALTLAGIRRAERPAAIPLTPGVGPDGLLPAIAPSPAGADPNPPTVGGLLRTARVLQIGLLVTIAANLGAGGASDVALPALAHGPLNTGADGYGALIAVLGAGALLGTIVAGNMGRARRPAITASVIFLFEALFMAAIPYLGGAPGAGAALLLFGAMNGFGNVIMITAWQRWVPAALMGRLNGIMMSASYGIFPISVLLGAIVVRNLGPAAFFPMAAGLLALALLVGLTQQVWRDYGSVPAHVASRTAPEPLNAPVAEPPLSAPTPSDTAPATRYPRA